MQSNKLYLVLLMCLVPSVVYSAAGEGISTWPEIPSVADGDLVAGTDVSNVTGSDDGTSVKIPASKLATYMQGFFYTEPEADSQLSGKEDSLGNPDTDGYVLSSTTLGVRSWVELASGGATQLDALTDVTGEGTTDYMLYDDGDGTYSFRSAPIGSFTYPTGTGIVQVTSGSSWGTTLTYPALTAALDDETWTFTNSVTAPGFISNAADGDRRIELLENSVGNEYTTWTGKSGLVWNNGVLSFYQNGTALLFNNILQNSDIGTSVLAPDGSAASLTNFPTLNQNTTGTAANITGTAAIANGGTGSTTVAGARTALDVYSKAETDSEIVSERTTTGTLTNKTIDGDDNTLQDINSSALDLPPTILSSTQALTDLHGNYIINGLYTITLPAVESGDWGCFQVYGAYAATIDPNISDLVILDGTALTDGTGIVSDGATGNSICLQYYDATGWITWGANGWASE